MGSAPCGYLLPCIFQQKWPTKERRELCQISDPAKKVSGLVPIVFPRRDRENNGTSHEERPVGVPPREVVISQCPKREPAPHSNSHEWVVIGRSIGLHQWGLSGMSAVKRRSAAGCDEARITDRSKANFTAPGGVGRDACHEGEGGRLRGHPSTAADFTVAARRSLFRCHLSRNHQGVGPEHSSGICRNRDIRP